MRAELPREYDHNFDDRPDQAEMITAIGNLQEIPITAARETWDHIYMSLLNHGGDEAIAAFLPALKARKLAAEQLEPVTVTAIRYTWDSVFAWLLGHGGDMVIAGFLANLSAHLMGAP